MGFCAKTQQIYFAEFCDETAHSRQPNMCWQKVGPNWQKVNAKLANLAIKQANRRTTRDWQNMPQQMLYIYTWKYLDYKKKQLESVFRAWHGRKWCLGVKFIAQFFLCTILRVLLTIFQEKKLYLCILLGVKIMAANGGGQAPFWSSQSQESSFAAISWTTPQKLYLAVKCQIHCIILLTSSNGKRCQNLVANLNL